MEQAMLSICTAIMLVAPITNFETASDQCKVNVRWPSAERDVLIVEGETYTLHVGAKQPALEGFSVAGSNVLADRLIPTIDGQPLQGPGRINIYNFGTQLYEIHLRDLKHASFPDSDIELAIFAYDKRVFVNINVVAKSWHTVEVGWKGQVDHSQLLYVPQRPGTQLMDGSQAMFELTEQAPVGLKGERSASIVLLAGVDDAETLHLRRQEAHHDCIRISADGGRVAGYVTHQGFYEINTIYDGPRSFETAWINPNQRYEVAFEISRDPSFGGTVPSEIILNVRNSYGVLEASVLTDADGFPLPVQVMTCKNFGGEKEEGRAEGDHPYGEAYIPITVDGTTPFRGKVYHLFGNWGTHPLKQISSIRFFHHYFHASLGPTETICYVPFEFPRDDGRNYVLADVRGLSNFAWPGQPQHDHVSLVGFLRYKSRGGWVNNLLQDTRIYLTAPNIACFAMDYISEDEAVKSTLEFVETPEDDETRCYVHMHLEVLKDVPLDEDSAHHLRFLNAGSYIVRTKWPRVAYTNSSGATVVQKVSDNDTWALEAEPLGADVPFVAGFPHEHGNMAFVIQDFKGRLGGEDVSMFGLSVFGGKQWSELVLTAPKRLKKLHQGDHFDAKMIVMPYGHAAVDHAPAERQRLLFGPKVAKLSVRHGTKCCDFPLRLKADTRGFADFSVEDGNNWTVILVEGFDSHKAPMLWEQMGGEWLFHDQQIYGNDWYQSYRAMDGTIGFAFAVKLRPDMKHRYVVSVAPSATAITQHNGFVTVRGGPMDFISPRRFAELDCQPVAGTELFRCSGSVESATMSGR
jgi:hypothetical protein